MHWFLMQPHHLSSLQGRHRVGPAVVITELNLVHVRGWRLNDRSNLAADQAMLWQVLKQRNDRKHLNFGYEGPPPHRKHQLANRETAVGSFMIRLNSNPPRSSNPAATDPNK